MASLQECAVNLLARREHSVHELRQKLMPKAESPEELEALLLKLTEGGLQSDARFVEAFVSSRISSGFGSRRIASELSQRRVDDELIAEHLSADDDHWSQVLSRLSEKKYHGKAIADNKDYMRRCRFFMQRGFEMSLIRRLLAHNNEYDYNN